MEFNPNELGDLVDLANKSGGALKTAIDIYDRLKKAFSGQEPVSDSEMELLVLKLMDEVKDARLANIALKDELLTLHEKAARAKRMEEEFSRYELWKSPAGAVIYRLKEDCADREPTHYICPNCKEEGRKSILQGHEYSVGCGPCDCRFYLRNRNRSVHSPVKGLP